MTKEKNWSFSYVDRDTGKRVFPPESFQPAPVKTVAPTILHAQNLPVVQCAVCKRPVDRMTCWWDPLGKDYIFVVRCHGQREEHHLDPALLDPANREGGGIVEAVAFVPKLPGSAS